MHVLCRLRVAIFNIGDGDVRADVPVLRCFVVFILVFRKVNACCFSRFQVRIVADSTPSDVDCVLHSFHERPFR